LLFIGDVASDDIEPKEECAGKISHGKRVIQGFVAARPVRQCGGINGA
jgi:hypothetical protein